MYEKFVGGEWSHRGDRVEITNPATGDAVDVVALGNLQDIEAAVRAASTAATQPWWREAPTLRAEFLKGWGDRLFSHRHSLAQLLTLENGKILGEAEQEIAATIDTLYFAAGQARQIEGRSLTLGLGLYGDIIPEPLGVVAFIIPWNWPVLLLMRELAPALAAGNAAVIKPSLLAPLTVTALFHHLPTDVRFPSGLLNVIPGGGADIGEALVRHPLIRAISFTGSTEVGQRIAALSGESVKKVLLELGGKSASVVFEDAPLDKAIPALIKGAFGSAGQNCMAASRILVQDAVFDSVKARLIAAIEGIRVGPGSSSDSTMGPLITAKQVARTDQYVQISADDGGRVVIGGHQLTDGALKRGYFYAPTLVEGVPLKSRAIQEEVFGPVVSLERFSDEGEAVRLANGTPYGLTASVWTTNHRRALQMSRQLEVGTIWINTYQRTFAEAESGGMKHSGLGRSRGRAGLYEYTELKHVLTDINP